MLQDFQSVSDHFGTSCIKETLWDHFRTFWDIMHAQSVIYNK